MKQKNLFNELILELIKCNTEVKLDLKNDFGGMQTSDNGGYILLSKKAATFINIFSQVLYDNFRNKDKVDYRAFHSVVTKKIANYITSTDLNLEHIEENRKALQDCIEKEFEEIEDIKITHHFPASTLKLNIEKTIILGCVHIHSIKNWLDTVDFSTETKQWYKSNRNNELWKNDVLNCLEKRVPETEIDGLAEAVYKTVKNSNSIVSIEIRGYEKRLSEKFARQVCKTSLDMLSLILADQRVFYNNVLQLERLPSLNYGEFTETNSYLNLPSAGISKAFLPPLEDKDYEHIGNLIERMLIPYSFIINGLVHPNTVSCPNLVSKWVFALNWYAEGMRESNDAIAVAKLASCLDTLSCSGKLRGIKQVLCNIYNCEDDYILFGTKELNPITIHTFVKKFYDDGRSRILHGTLESMLESFETDRNRLAEIARWVLLELANRLCIYKGEDTETAFRTMQYDD
ncbi:hypothetical protein [Acinetobacter pittii]|uniref:hypothetical protein n=1 Tax=Acinetobacter pittii TaxID=48296 RepID=UPI00331F736C